MPSLGEPDMTQSVATLGEGYLEWTRYLQAFRNLDPWFFSQTGQVRRNMFQTPNKTAD
jgi:hypothetical protein